MHTAFDTRVGPRAGHRVGWRSTSMVAAAKRPRTAGADRARTRVSSSTRPASGCSAQSPDPADEDAPRQSDRARRRGGRPTKQLVLAAAHRPAADDRRAARRRLRRRQRAWSATCSSRRRTAWCAWSATATTTGRSSTTAISPTCTRGWSANEDASGVYHANDEGDERVNDIVAAIGPYVPVRPDVRHVPIEEARSKMGPFADALSLDQVVRSPRARALGWTPTLQSVAGNAARLLEEWRESRTRKNRRLSAGAFESVRKCLERFARALSGSTSAVQNSRTPSTRLLNPANPWTFA